MYEINKFLNALCRTSIYPGIILIPWVYGLISLYTVKICLVIFAIIFVIAPITFKYSISFQRAIFFLQFISQDCDLNHPHLLGLYATRNFHITYTHDVDVTHVYTDYGGGDIDIKLGAWHILPVQVAKKFSRELNLDNEAIEDVLNSTDVTDTNLDKVELEIKSEYPVVNKDNEKLFYEKMLEIPGIIILYLHGNSGTRGKNHRVTLYKILSKLGYHVITFDYRSFGDSTNIQPSEYGCVSDTIAVYNYIKSRTNNPVFIWGHSLGSGIAAHVLAKLNEYGIYGPLGIILESPFTNINEEIRNYPMAFFFKYLPWFENTVSAPIYNNYLRFESDQHICEFRQPVLILHAEDDLVVPFHLGYKLYRKALDFRGRGWGPVQFHRFSSSKNYGHNYINRAPELPNIIKKFIDDFQNALY